MKYGRTVAAVSGARWPRARLNLSSASASNGRAQGDVDLIGAGLDVLADAVDDLLVAAGEHSRGDVLGERAELRLQALVASMPGRH